MIGCVYCEVKNVCLQCESGMILTLAAKCQAACPINIGYLNKNESTCVVDCDANDFGRKINSASTKCVDACNNDEWYY